MLAGKQWSNLACDFDHGGRPADIAWGYAVDALRFWPVSVSDGSHLCINEKIAIAISCRQGQYFVIEIQARRFDIDHNDRLQWEAKKVIRNVLVDNPIKCFWTCPKILSLDTVRLFKGNLRTNAVIAGEMFPDRCGARRGAGGGINRILDLLKSTLQFLRASNEFVEKTHRYLISLFGWNHTTVPWNSTVLSLSEPMTMSSYPPWAESGDRTTVDAPLYSLRIT